MPRERADRDFGPVVLRPPPLDDARIGVDDPILPHAFALIEPALYLAIGARCRWRKDLDGKEQRADVGPLSGSLPLWPYRYDEKIGLDEHVLMERDVCGRHDDFAPALAVQVVGQMSEEPTDDPLMRPGWSGGHEQLSVDDLVAVAVVGKRAGHFRGPVFSGVRHTHIVLGSAGEEQVDTRQDEQLSVVTRY